uniref:NADH-ubiquinone oxidoreductase chain 1 n=1 Tax=Tetrodontophora bielanensis TaxID=48717 RepID=Q9B505_TETBI|nr:NADH dehydrogenase subunit 1 [Tetrodontophora bielanensis]AAK30952.1 NADH dehydrogenase subunit 1 [Tetrodontophora bielanensis]
MSYVSLFISYLLMVLGVLISVAFMILLERSVLGYNQLRKGPNKVGYLGILQSFGDAMKLFMKEQTLPLYSNLKLFYLAPVFSLLVILLLWMIMPTYSNFMGMTLGGLFFFCCTGLGVYTLLASGWASNSFYAMLGAMRGVAQTISYEVSMALLFLGFIFLLMCYNLVDFNFNQEYIWFVVMYFPIFLCWLLSSLAETNRSPFDFAEGESELVSGFNIEYGSGGFALLFLAEYASIIFMSYLMSLFYFGGFGGPVFMNLIGFIFCFIFIWVRGTLPRYRYDKLMYLSWKSILPISLNMLILYFVVGVMFNCWNF